jgi:signal transduction histidine kinase
MNAPDPHLTCFNAAKKNIHLLYEKFIKPRATDEDSARREYILNVILIGSIMMLAALDVSVLYYSLRMGSSYDGVPFAIFSIIPIFFVLLYLLSRKGSFVASSYLLVGTYFASNSFAAYYWSVRLPTVLIGYVIIILISSILVDTRFGFFMTGLIALFVIPIGYAQCNHLIPIRPQTNTNSSGSIVFAILFFLIMVLSWLSNREIEKSLFRARKSERELKRERDNLEITVEERTQELRKTQFEKIEQIYRFAEFGQLASGIFHDILNLLNAISLRAEDNPKEKYPLAEAFGTAKLIEGLIQAIRKQLDHHESYELFSLVESINQAIQLVAYKANKGKVRIIFHHDRNAIPFYFGNPFKFHQVIINTLINAIECYDGLPENDQRKRVAIIHLEEGGGVITVRVEDRGCGISAEIQEKIFEPFFSTKSGARGSGIGLATVKKIVEEDMHGTIALSTQEGKRSIFTIAFPVRMAPPPDNK